MADEIPGFGGLYLDADGRKHVYFTDPSSEAARSMVEDDVVVRQGRFDFRSLLTWKRDLRSKVLALPGVLSLDIDETTNSIVIGVDPSARVADVKSLADRLKVPEDAFRVEEVEPVSFTANLRNYVGVRRGGLQTQFFDNGTATCSIGFIVNHLGPLQNNRGMVTASHCSADQGVVEGTVFHQPTTGSPGFAREILDPAHRTVIPGGGCPAGRVCRLSDALFAANTNPFQTHQIATIARTQSRSRTSGSLDIHPTRPSLTIAAESPNATMGRQLNKIGRTTGWTFGYVNATCMDVNIDDTQITFLCQNRVSGGVSGGDSGSPVFYWFGNDYVVLHGLLWGQDDGGDGFFYSPPWSGRSGARQSANLDRGTPRRRVHLHPKRRHLRTLRILQR